MHAKTLLTVTALVLLTHAAVAVGPPPHVDRHGDPLPADALLRLGTLRHREGRLWWQSCQQLLTDGRTLLVGRQNTIVVVDRASGARRGTWVLPKGYEVCGFSPDGRLALVTDGKSTFSTYDFRAGKWGQHFEDKGPLRPTVRSAFRADGRIVATMISVNFQFGLLHVWEVATGKHLWSQGTLGSSRGIHVLGFLPDGKSLAFLHWPSYGVRVCEALTGRELLSFETGLRNEGRSWQLSPDGQTVGIGTAGTSVRFWDVTTGKELTPLGGHVGQANSFAFSRDGALVATGGEDPFILIHDWPSGKRCRRIEFPKGKWGGRMEFSSDGNRLLVEHGGDEAVSFYDVATGQPINDYPEAHTGQVFGLGVTPDGQVVSGGQDNTQRIWDLKSGRQLRQTHLGHPVGAMTLSVSPDGRRIATGDVNEGVVRLFDRPTGIAVATFPVARSIRQVHFGGQHRLLVSADARAAGTGSAALLSLRDATTGTELRRLADLGFGSCAISRDGELVAGPHPDGPALWDAGSGRKMRELPKNTGEFAFAPDGRSLAMYGSERGLVRWDVATGQPRWQAESAGARAPRRLAFSPEGRWLAVARDFYVELWDAQRGRLVHVFRGHDSSVTVVAFSADVRKLVSGSSDTTLLVWDLASVLARQPRGATPLQAETLAHLWQDLGAVDPQRAAGAMARLVDAPGQSVPWLRARLRPGVAPDRALVQRLLKQLDGEAFADREAASRALEKHGPDAEAELRAFLTQKLSVEARRRGERLAQRVAGGGLSDPEYLRQWRALEVLETIGDNKALDVLRLLASGPRDAWLSRQAASAVRRLRE